MKKLALLVFLGLLVTGCKGKITLEKELEQMDRILEYREIFSGDYTLSKKIIHDDGIRELILKKDNDRYYIKSGKHEYYFINHYLYYNDTYNQYDDVISATYEVIKREGFTLNFELEKMYLNVKNEINNFISKCEESERYSCTTSSDKKDLIFNLIYEDSKSKSEIKYTLNNGKIMAIDNQVTIENNTIRSLLSIDYNDNKIVYKRSN